MQFAKVGLAAGVITLLMLQGCVSTQYEVVAAEDTRIGSLALSLNDNRWNLAPRAVSTHLHKTSSIWTRDGVLLDQLILLAPIDHEQELFVSNDPDKLVYPTFRKEMLPNEVEELLQDSLTRQLGGGATVVTSNLRPRPWAGQRGIAFDLLIEYSDAAAQRGYVCAAVIDDQLHLIIYQAAKLHYFDTHWPAASAVIDSAQTLAARN